jgi:hypothetical protein
MAIGLTRLHTVAVSLLDKKVPLPADFEGRLDLEAIAARRHVSLRAVMREALTKGAQVHDFKELEQRLQDLTRERDGLLSKREELAGTFAKLSMHESTLRFNYFEISSDNKALTINLCGLGLGQKYREMLDRYLFSGRSRAKENTDQTG